LKPGWSKPGKAKRALIGSIWVTVYGLPLAATLYRPCNCALSGAVYSNASVISCGCRVRPKSTRTTPALGSTLTYLPGCDLPLASVTVTLDTFSSLPSSQTWSEARVSLTLIVVVPEKSFCVGSTLNARLYDCGTAQ